MESEYRVCSLSTKTCLGRALLRLTLFRRNEEDFFMREVIVDERRLYHYIPKWDRDLVKWIANSESRLKRSKTHKSVSSVMASVFRDTGDIKFTDSLEKRQRNMFEWQRCKKTWLYGQEKMFFQHLTNRLQRWQNSTEYTWSSFHIHHIPPGDYHMSEDFIKND